MLLQKECHTRLELWQAAMLQASRAIDHGLEADKDTEDGGKRFESLVGTFYELDECIVALLEVVQGDGQCA